MDLEVHIPIIASFWESVVFNTRGYRGDVMEIHRRIHRISNIGTQHLDRWVRLFLDSIDAYFAGNNAELMKQRARSIATVMQMKLDQESLN